MFCYTDLRGDIRLFISGIGKDDTVRFFEEFDKNRDKYFTNNNRDRLYFKFGTCGILDRKYEKLKIVIPRYVCCNNLCKVTDEVLSLKKFYVDDKLLTVDKILEDVDKAAGYNNLGYSFVDMESFYLLEKFNVVPVLVGTDYCDSVSKKDFLTNLSLSSTVLKDFFIREIYGKTR